MISMSSNIDSEINEAASLLPEPSNPMTSETLKLSGNFATLASQSDNNGTSEFSLVHEPLSPDVGENFTETTNPLHPTDAIETLPLQKPEPKAAAETAHTNDQLKSTFNSREEHGDSIKGLTSFQSDSASFPSDMGISGHPLSCKKEETTAIYSNYQRESDKKSCTASVGSGNSKNEATFATSGINTESTLLRAISTIESAITQLQDCNSNTSSVPSRILSQSINLLNNHVSALRAYLAELKDGKHHVYPAPVVAIPETKSSSTFLTEEPFDSISLDGGEQNLSDKRDLERKGQRQCLSRLPLSEKEEKEFFSKEVEDMRRVRQELYSNHFDTLIRRNDTHDNFANDISGNESLGSRMISTSPAPTYFSTSTESPSLAADGDVKEMKRMRKEIRNLFGGILQNFNGSNGSDTTERNDGSRCIVSTNSTYTTENITALDVLDINNVTIDGNATTNRNIKNEDDFAASGVCAEIGDLVASFHNTPVSAFVENLPAPALNLSPSGSGQRERSIAPSFAESAKTLTNLEIQTQDSPDSSGSKTQNQSGDMSDSRKDINSPFSSQHQSKHRRRNHSRRRRHGHHSKERSPRHRARRYLKKLQSSGSGSDAETNYIIVPHDTISGNIKSISAADDTAQSAKVDNYEIDSKDHTRHHARRHHSKPRSNRSNPPENPLEHRDDTHTDCRSKQPKDDYSQTRNSNGRSHQRRHHRRRHESHDNQVDTQLLSPLLDQRQNHHASIDDAGHSDTNRNISHKLPSLPLNYSSYDSEGKFRNNTEGADALPLSWAEKAVRSVLLQHNYTQPPFYTSMPSAQQPAFSSFPQNSPFNQTRNNNTQFGAPEHSFLPRTYQPYYNSFLPPLRQQITNQAQELSQTSNTCVKPLQLPKHMSVIHPTASLNSASNKVDNAASPPALSTQQQPSLKFPIIPTDSSQRLPASQNHTSRIPKAGAARPKNK